MFKNYLLIFILVLVLIIIYFLNKDEQFRLMNPLQDPNLQNCLNNCNRRDVQMANGYSNTKECQQSCNNKYN